MASSFAMSSAPESFYMDRKTLQDKFTQQPSPSFEWQGTGISLDSLYGLAQSLNIGDKELTPVQAWFELASRYGADMVLSQPVLVALKTELRDVVKCLYFGAVMEREAFESVVSRVLGPPPPSTVGGVESFAF